MTEMSDLCYLRKPRMVTGHSYMLRILYNFSFIDILTTTYQGRTIQRFFL